MARNRLLLALGLLASTAAGVVIFLWAITPRHRINPESFEKIQLGMSQEEVENILRVPPGDYGPGEAMTFKYFNFADSEPVSWLAGEYGIFVRYDIQQRVEAKWTQDIARRKESFFHRLRRCFRD
jgi:hypothetical protein